MSGELFQGILEINDLKTLNSLETVIKSRRREVVMNSIVPGKTKVRFEARGKMVTGAVQRVMKKNLAVNSDQGNWTVPPALILDIVESE